MTICNLSPPRLHMIHDKQLLILCWRSFLEWCREGVAICIAFNGSQKFLSDCLQHIISVITQDAWPQIIDALLSLIFKIGQGRYCNLLCLFRRPKIHLWLTATYWWCDYPGCIAKNCWSSVDAQFQDEVGSVSLKFCLYRRPILQLCITTSKSIFDY